MNSLRKSKVSVLASRILLALLAIVVLSCERSLQVERTTPQRGRIQESFREPAKTRLAKTYPIVMPVSARIDRIDLEPGDPVQKGQVLVEIDRVPFLEALAEAKAAADELLARIAVKDDNRLEEIALEEARASVEAAEDTLRAADAQIEAEQARAERARKERARMEQLAAEKAVTESQLEDAQLHAETSLIELSRQKFYRSALNTFLVIVKLGPRFVSEYISRKELEREVLVHQLAQARARLAKASHELHIARIVSPIQGIVLEKYEEGAGPLPAGRSLLLLGNMSELEAVADVLTQDALRLSPGSEVILEPASRREPLRGHVKQIEPAGFTKLSSLGVEQQRVTVIVELDENPGDLGVGYRLQARFFTGSREDALIVPRFSVLQSPEGSYYVLKIEDGRLTEQPVELGLRGDLELEIVSGLTKDDEIVSRPDTTMEAGMKVKE